MKFRASGRSALILAAGLIVCFTGPSPVAAAGADSTTAASKSDDATTGKSTRQSTRHSKRDDARKSDKTASKSSDTGKVADGDVTAGTPAAIPPSVANANAQLASDAPADVQAASDAHVVASDQLNDVDRELQQGQSSAPPTQAQTPPPPQPQTVAMAPVRATTSAASVLGNGESTTWDQTSLIGKIFIAFGALLTMASAARMFMA
jgi:hypothetical protein